MNVIEYEELLYEYELQNNGPPKLIVNKSELDDITFQRMGYQMILSSEEYGYQDLKITFDSIFKESKQYKIPSSENQVSMIRQISNIKTIYNKKENQYPYGTIRFTSCNYNPSDLTQLTSEGSYGAFQIFDDKGNVLFVYNNHNNVGDIGIFNSTEQFRYWTFSNNAKKYSFKQLYIYGINNLKIASYKYLINFVYKEKIVIPKYKIILDDTIFVQRDEVWKIVDSNDY